MKRIIIKLRNILGVLALVAIAAALIGVGVGMFMAPRVPAKVVLEVDLAGEFVEYKPASPIAQIVLKESTSLVEMLDALERASKDDRVSGIVAKVDDVNIGFATAQELRNAVLRFRASGKKAIAFADTFGEYGPGNVSYYLASAFDEIHMQPSGDLGLIGLSVDAVFLRGMFDKLNIGLRADSRKEYKSAKNMFTEQKFTDAHREATTKVLRSIVDQMIEDIADGRKLEPTKVRALIDAGPYLGEEAVKAGLVDKLSYWDEIRARVDSDFGEDVKTLFMSKYSERAGGAFNEGPVIALVHAVGPVQRAKEAYDPMSGFVTASDAVTDALRAAANDDAVKAIVFRVNSPGGSYVASDSIWREVAQAKAAGKPVIVSMGDVAGSGGYFVAMNADKIVANPATITGSIGVLNVKFLTRKLWERFGITFDHVATSSRAKMYSGLHDYSDEEWARFQAWLDRIYDDFTTKVAEGRGLSKDKVLEIAKGRIWTGVDAKERGLVDALGGIHVAIEVAKESAGIDKSDSIELRAYPKAKSPVELLLSEGRENSDPEAAAIVRTIRTLRPFVNAAKEITAERPPVAIETPVLDVR